MQRSPLDLSGLLCLWWALLEVDGGEEFNYVEADYEDGHESGGYGGGFEQGVDAADLAADFGVFEFAFGVDIFVEEDGVDFMAGEVASVDDQRDESGCAKTPYDEHPWANGHWSVPRNQVAVRDSGERGARRLGGPWGNDTPGGQRAARIFLRFSGEWPDRGQPRQLPRQAGRRGGDPG